MGRGTEYGGADDAFASTSLLPGLLAAQHLRAMREQVAAFIPQLHD